MNTANAVGVVARRSNTALQSVNFISPDGYTDLNPTNMDNLRDKVYSNRRVVSRAGTSSAARSGVVTTNNYNNFESARSGATNNSYNNSAGARRVVARRSNATDSARSAVVSRSARGDESSYYSTTLSSSDNALTTTSLVSPTQCMSDYTTCMNDYCERKDTQYNKCYCSAQLAQIDAKYQPTITELIKQIAVIQGAGGTLTDSEMEDLWGSIFTQYTNENSLANLNDAIENLENIDWTNTESRVRGANAFVIGHEYCVQHLRGCFSMAESMRGVYRSSISRDCASYENYLNNIKTAAETFIEASATE